MKAITNIAPDQLAWRTYPLPEPGVGQVRVRSGAVGICATDLEMIAGWKRTKPPNIPGHEWAGFIDAVGLEVDSAFVGQRCVAENVLSDGGEVGFEHSGAYGEYFLTEASNIHLLPDNFPLTTAALIEPLAVVTRALRRLSLTDHPHVLISGDGPIGLITLMCLRYQGIKHIAIVGGRAGRLELAQSLGATTFDISHFENSITSTLQHHFSGTVSCIIEASGSAAALDTAFHLISRKGQLLLIGDYGQARANFPWNTMIHREIDMKGSNASAGAWSEASQLAIEGAIPLERIISHTFPVEQFEDAFSLVRSQGNDVVKVILEW